MCNTIGDDEIRQYDEYDEFPFAAFPVVDKINSVQDCRVNVRLSPLQYTDVFVNGLRYRASWSVSAFVRELYLCLLY